MAKPKGINQKAKYRAHSIRLARYADRVQSVYDTLSQEIANEVLRTTYDGSKPFRFKDYPLTQKKIEEVQAEFVRDLRSVIYSGTSAEWKESNLVQDLLVDKVLKFYGSSARGKKRKVYYQTNSDALKAFQERKTNGLNLSQRLWNQSKNFKEEMEFCISSGIQKGTSAITLSKRLSKYLVDFPSLKQDYKEKYGKAVTCQDCEYRSIRLARSEINMAYRTAEQERWKQFDFVLGYEVKTTQNGRHEEDMCDELAGRYPKDFKFVGWHPNCMCYVVPILKTEEQFFNEEEVEPIKDVPQSYRDWVTGNLKRIKEAEANGTLPYFLKDNPDFRKYLGVDYVADYRHRTRNEEEIRLAWKNRKDIVEMADHYRLNELRREARYIHFDTTEMEAVLRTTDLKYSKWGESSIFDSLYDKYKTELNTARMELNKAYDNLIKLKNQISTCVGAYNMNNLVDEIDDIIKGYSKYKPEYGNVYSKEQFVSLYRSVKKRFVANAKRVDSMNKEAIENALNIKKGHPMSFKEADEGRGNIGYKEGVVNPYSVNCQLSVIADELRRRGYNVTARGRIEGKGVADIIAKNTEIPWIERGTGHTPKKSHIYLVGKKDIEIFHELDDVTKTKGRYHINWVWSDEKSGHIVCLERKANGELRFYDPQDGEHYDIFDFISRMSKNFSLKVLKVDDLLLDPALVNSIVRPL